MGLRLSPSFFVSFKPPLQNESGKSYATTAFSTPPRSITHEEVRTKIELAYGFTITTPKRACPSLLIVHPAPDITAVMPCLRRASETAAAIS